MEERGSGAGGRRLPQAEKEEVSSTCSGGGGEAA